MTSKRLKVSIIYFVVVLLTLLMRVASALDIYSALGIEDEEAFWSCMIQIVIFGIVPACLYLVFVAGKPDKLLSYFPMRKPKKRKGDSEESEKAEEFCFASTEYQRETVLDVVDEDGVDEVAALDSSLSEDVQQNKSNEVAEGDETSANSLSGDAQQNQRNEVAEVAEGDEANANSLSEDAQQNKSNEVAEVADREKKGEKAIVAFKALFGDFGFKKVSGRDALRTLVLAICMIVLGSAVSMLWQMVLSLTGYTRSSSHTHYSDILVLLEEFVLVAILPGFFEEFTHRGLLSAGYKECGWKFVVLSALFFSLMHQNITQTGYTFTDGLMMALVMYYTGSIWPSMFMHFLNNAWSVFMGYVADTGGVFEFLVVAENWLYSTVGGLIVIVFAVLVCSALVVLMFWRMRSDAVKKARIDDRPFKDTLAYPLVKDFMFWLIVAVGVAATTFSFVWGIIR